jgi:carboxyl-terminal processing protease
MVEVVLFQIFCSSRVEHGNENTVYLMKSGMVNFVFEQLDKNRMTFKGLSFAQFKGEMDKTNLYYNAFQKT